MKPSTILRRAMRGSHPPSWDWLFVYSKARVVLWGVELKEVESLCCKVPVPADAPPVDPNWDRAAIRKLGWEHLVAR